MSLKIYTKTGDKGTTSLIGGTKVSKANIRIESYGTVDELNSFIGLCIDTIKDEKSEIVLKEIQDRLFTIGSSLACDPEKEPQFALPDLIDDDIIFLENEIDEMNSKLPAMKNFVLPGGHVAVSHLHIARCVCRRAERVCVNMQDNHIFVDAIVTKYLNRLSDYLFILARYATHIHNANEIAWKPRIKK